MGGCGHSESGVKGWARTLRAQGVGWDLGCELQVVALVVWSVKDVGVVSSALGFSGLGTRPIYNKML